MSSLYLAFLWEMLSPDASESADAVAPESFAPAKTGHTPSGKIGASLPWHTANALKKTLFSLIAATAAHGSAGI